MKKIKEKSKKMDPAKEELKSIYKQLAIIMPIGLFFLFGGIYETYRVKKVFAERGKITAATILSSGGKYADFQYEVDGKVYTKTERKPYIYEFKIGGKYKLVYDPLDPETCDLCMDDNNQYFPMEDSVPPSGKQTEKVQPDRGKEGKP